MSEFAGALRVLEKFGEALDMRHSAAALGEWFGQREAHVFDSSGGPEPFAPLAESTLRKKRKLGQSRKPLIATGAMQRDFSAGNVEAAYENRVIVGPRPGDSRDYAFWAARNTPHRDPTPEITRDEVPDIIAVVVRSIKQRIKALAGSHG